MRVAVTGTPGTGKTTATERLSAEIGVVHLNDAIREAGLYTERDEERDSLVADLDAVDARYADREDVLVESHLAHYLSDLDAVVVLRCEPETLEARLRERGGAGDGGADLAAVHPDAREAPGSAEPARALAREARENAEAEALDVILAEAVDRHGAGRVYEVDTTDRTPDEVADAVAAVLDGEREPSAGEVDFTGYLL